MTDLSLESIEDALVLAGLFEGYPSQRRGLASTLLSRGVVAEDVQKLGNWSQRAFTKTRQLAGLRNVLEDVGRCREVLADLTRMADRKQEVSMATKFAPPTGDIPPADREAWDETDRALALTCRVDSDGRELEAIAVELNLDLGMAQHLLAKGRAIRQEQAKVFVKTKTKTKPKPDQTPAERLHAFRQFLADGGIK